MFNILETYHDPFRVEKNVLLETSQQMSGDISIYSPAVKSSGDAYHIAAYGLLCLHFNWQLPKVYLCYDSKDTKLHANRAYNFLNFLFREQIKCHVIKAPTNCYQYPSRTKAAIKAVTQHSKVKVNSESLLNQKITTAFIQAAVLKHGHKKIARILDLSFKNKSALREHGQPIFEWVAIKITCTKGYLEKQPFIVIHNRFSNDTNDNQNLSTELVQKIMAQFKEFKLKVILVNVSSEKVSVISDAHQIEAFEKITNLDPMLTKFQHILLCSALSKLSGFRGVIGGTSGTLDVLAFMGIPVLNIHKFSKHEKLTYTPHQDFRILLQSTFMAVCSCDDVSMNVLYYWLKLGNFLFAHGNIPLGLSDKKDSQKDREIFWGATNAQSETRMINPYYKMQKQILKKQCLVKECLDERNEIKMKEQQEFTRLKKAYSMRSPSPCHPELLRGISVAEN